MIDPLVPIALLAAALALCLAFAERSTALICVPVFIAVSLLTALLPIGADRIETIVAGAWIAVIATALTVHWRASGRLPLAAPISAHAGIWCGLLAASAGGYGDLATGLPAALLFLPGGWIAARGYRIVIKVVASWLVAIGLLLIALPLVTTPGYQSDHRD